MHISPVHPYVVAKSVFEKSIFFGHDLQLLLHGKRIEFLLLQ